MIPENIEHIRGNQQVIDKPGEEKDRAFMRCAACVIPDIQTACQEYDPDDEHRRADQQDDVMKHRGYPATVGNVSGQKTGVKHSQNDGKNINDQ